MQFEGIKYIVAVSALAVVPPLSETPVDRAETKAYVREEDVLVLGGLATNMNNRHLQPGNNHQQRTERNGHLVHRLAGRNQQAGHRFRGDTRN